MKTKRLAVFIILVLVVLGSLLVLTACGNFPGTLKISYVDVGTGKNETISVKRIYNGGRGYFSEVTETWGIKKVVYVDYEGFELPTQTLDGWEFLGYARTSDIRLAKGRNNEALFSLLGDVRYLPKELYFSPVWRRKAASFTVIDLGGNPLEFIWYRYYGLYENGGSIEYLETNSVKDKLSAVITDVAHLDGIYDEQAGGAKMIDSTLNALFEMKDLSGKTLYMRYCDFSIEIDAGGGEIQSLPINLNQKMPSLPTIQEPLGKTCAGWRVKGTSAQAADKNGSYTDGMSLFTLTTYGQHIQGGVLALEPIYDNESITITFSDSTQKTYIYGQFVDYIPNAPTIHQKFIGWTVPAGQPFDGFACEDITLNATWSFKTYNFEFVLNGGTSLTDLDNIQYVYGGNIISFPNAIEKNGYTFIGWFASATTGAEQYSDGVGVPLVGKNIFTDEIYSIDQSGVVKLYAHYVAN